ncbi:MAG: hypothetical protein V1738_03720 [Patescibacteria group bacterium]
MNGEYIKSLSQLDLALAALPFYERDGLIERDGGLFRNTKTGTVVTLDQLAKIVSVEQQRVKTLAEIPAATEFLFVEHLAYDAAIIPWKKSTPAAALERLEGILKHMTDLAEEKFSSVQLLETDVIAFVAECGWTNAEALWPMRVALTAKAASPSPFEVAWVLGKTATITRLKDAIALL